jgi:hypothetical protein
MATNYIAPTWRMPENTNKDKLSNYSINFDGTSGNVNLGTDVLFDSTKGFSFSAWVYLDAYTVSYPAIVKLITDKSATSSTCWSMGVSNTAGYTGVFFGSSSDFAKCTTDGDISGDFIGAWKHVCVTFDGVDRGALSSYKTYVDGVNITLVAAGLFGATSTASSRIGWAISTNYWDGKIDQVCIFDYELSTDQVTYLYNLNNPMAISGPKPIVYYPLGDNSNPTSLPGYPNISVGDSVFNFTGANSENINLGTTPFSFTQNLTVSFWAKFSQTATNSFLGKDNNTMTGGRNWMIYQGASQPGQISFWTTTDGATTSGYQVITGNISINNNEWHHVVCINDYTNGTKQIYIDGSLDITNNEGAAISTSSAMVQIGNRDTNPRYPYDGEMSNVALWNTALTSTQVETLYNNGAPNDISSLSPTAWYKLDSSEIFNSTSTEWSVDNNAYPSVYKSSLNFEKSPGSSNYVDTNTTVASNLDFSVSAWIKPTSYSTVLLGTRGLAAAGDSNGITMNINSSGNLWARIFTETSNVFNLQTGSVIALNSWSHVAMTYDSSTKTLKSYLNGTQAGSMVGTDPSVASTADLDVGRASIGTFYDYFDGEISNAAIFNTELTSTQVTTIYNNGTPEASISHSPVSWYKLDNTTIQDSAGSNNGTNNGATEYDGFVNALAGESSGMTSANLIQSDLYRTTPYSNYSINFDSPSGDYFNFNNASSNIMANKNTISISAWFKLDSNTTSSVVSNWYGGGLSQYLIRYNTGANLGIQWYVKIGSTAHRIDSNYYPSVGDWVHVVGVKDPITNGGQIRLYINNSHLYTLDDTNISNPVFSNNGSDQIGVFNNASNFMDGSISNVAYWTNTALTQVEAVEIYNAGVTTNLSNFSGTAPDHWCTLDGKKVYYNGSVIVARDAIGTLQATGVNLVQENIVGNAPGSNSNGTGSNLDISDLKGNMSNSTKNAKSINMADYGDPNAQGVTPANSGRTTSVPG